MTDCLTIIRRLFPVGILLAASSMAWADAAPDPFDFLNVRVPVKEQVFSNVVTVAGIDEPTPIQVTGHKSGRFQINGGEWLSGSGTVNPGDRVGLRLRSRPTASPGSRSLNVVIGGVSDVWQVTTSTGVPPRPDKVFNLGGTSPGLPCGGTVRCVSPGESIQAAIDAAASGDVIQVAAGTYDGNLLVSGKTLRLLGGFPASGGFASRTPLANATILRGAGGNPVVTLESAGRSVLDGFRITNGTGNVYGGGGVFTFQGDVKISNNIIENNAVCSAPGESCQGGGIFILDGPARIVRNIVRGNIASRGGGIASNGSGALSNVITIKNNLVENNEGTDDHGGGMYVFGNLRILRNLVRGNVIGQPLGYGWGGGICVIEAGGPAQLANNRITGNSAPSLGGGVFFDEGATANMFGDLVYANTCGSGIYVDGAFDARGSISNIVNVTVANHVCPDGTGQAIFVEGGSTVNVTNSIFHDNGGVDASFFDCVDPVGQSCAPTNDPTTLTITYTLLGGYPGTGNFDADPQFVDPANGDYHLGPSSPAIDAANPASSIGEEPEPNGDRRNLGTYGGTSEATTSP